MKDICTICLSTLNKKNNILLKCGHEYHYQCFITYIINNHNKCSTCRTNIEIVDNFDIKILYKKIMGNVKIDRCFRIINTFNIEKQCRNNIYIGNDGFCKIHKNPIIEDKVIKKILLCFLSKPKLLMLSTSQKKIYF